MGTSSSRTTRPERNTKGSKSDGKTTRGSFTASKNVPMGKKARSATKTKEDKGSENKRMRKSFISSESSSDDSFSSGEK